MDHVNVLVAFYSRTGATERVAVWIAEGAIQAGAKIRLRRARDVLPKDVISRFPEWAENGERMDKEYAAPRLPDAQWADAIIIGTPDRDVVMSTELKAYLDLLAISGPERHFERKVGSVFSSSYDQVLGRPAVLDGEKALLDLGFLVAPAGRETGSLEGEKRFDLAHAHGRRSRKSHALST